MDLYIENLAISYIAKKHLLNLGFITTSDLLGYDYFSLLELYPNCRIISQITEELISLDYLLPLDSALYIYNVSMSTKLKNILKRNHILYLSQLSAYPEELIRRFRNLGAVTMNELKYICQKYQIYIRSLTEIKEFFGKYHFPIDLYYNFFSYNITSLNDFKCKTVSALHNICNRDYLLTMKVYALLKKNHIELKNSDSIYLFEVLPFTKARILWMELHIQTINELSAYSEEELLNIDQIAPNTITSLNVLLKEKQLSFRPSK